MNIVFRVDVSADIGTGHLIRCINLALKLKNKGHDITFVCRNFSIDALSRIEQHDMSLVRLPVDKGGLNNPIDASTHQKWLGESWENDLSQTLEGLSSTGKKYDHIIIDHYGLDYRWMSGIRNICKNVIVIDDLADRVLDANIIINPSLWGESEKLYVGLNSCPDANVFIGPSFAILHEDFFKLSQGFPRIKTFPPKNITIYFGGQNHIDLTIRVAQLCANLIDDCNEIRLVLPEYNSKFKKFLENSNFRTKIKVFQNLKSMAAIYASSDLAIGAAGVSSWERLCFGVFSIVVSIAENQLKIADDLAGRGLISYAGHLPEQGFERIVTSIEEKIISLNEDKVLSAKHYPQFSRGSEKVSNLITRDN